MVPPTAPPTEPIVPPTAPVTEPMVPRTPPSRWPEADVVVRAAIRIKARTGRLDISAPFSYPLAEETSDGGRFIPYEVQCRPCRSSRSWPLYGLASGDSLMHWLATP